MKLSAYLKEKNLTYAAFGRKCAPEIPRVTIRQYALELRFPASRETFAVIEKASDGEVTANDFIRAEAAA